MKKLFSLFVVAFMAMSMMADWSLSYKLGDEGTWNNAVAPLADGSVYLNLEASSTYYLFIVADAQGWAWGDATMTEGNSTNYDLQTYDDATYTGLKVQTTNAGVYKFTASYFDAIQHLTAVYPSASSNLVSYVYGNNYPALTWATLSNGNVQVSIADASGATNVTFRNGGLEGGLGGLKVCSGAGFSTKENADVYFTRTGGETGTKVVTLAKKADATLPSPCIIEFQTNALAWACDESAGAYNWPKFDYIYGTTVSQTLASLSVMQNKSICDHNETVTFSANVIGNYGAAMSASVTYNVAAEQGSMSGDVFTPASTFSGKATVVATATDPNDASIQVSETLYVFVYDATDNLVLSNTLSSSKIIAQSAENPNGSAFDAFFAVDPNDGSIWQGSATDGTAADEASRTYDAWFVADLGGFYDIDFVAIKFEGACSQNYTVDFSEDNNTWVNGYTFAGNAGIDGRTDLIYVGGEKNLQNYTKVRYVRFFSTKAATQYGMKVFYFKVFGSEWEIPHETEAPVMGAASVDSYTYNSAVINVTATDNVGIKDFHFVDATNSLDVYKSAAQGKATLTELTPNTSYTITITARDYSDNISENSAEVTFTTPNHLYRPTVAAPVPVNDESFVIKVYSDAFEGNEFSAHEGWGDATVYEELTFSENEHARLYHNINWLGWQGEPLNVARMEKLHIDIWADVDGQIGIVPIYGGAGLTTDDNQRKIVNLVGQQWNSFDFDLATDFSSLNLTSIFQFKFDNAQGDHFCIDNVYFWKEPTQTIYFINKPEWTSVASYTRSQSETDDPDAAGVATTKTEQTINGWEIWTIDVPADAYVCRFIGNDNAKSNDLYVRDGYYYTTTSYWCADSVQMVMTGAYLLGLDAEWKATEERNLVDPIKVKLDANADGYPFKVLDHGEWMGFSGEVNADNNERLFATGTDNCVFKTVGTLPTYYTIAYDEDSKIVTVTYPEVYYIKHPWAGGDWTWVEMAMNEDGTYSHEGQYGNNGCNYNTSASDTDSHWVCVADGNQTVIGQPAVGDYCTFALDPVAGTITVTRNENGWATGCDEVDATKAQKIVRDGKIVIIKNGVEYSVLGARL